MTPTLRIRHFTDPGCPFAYSAEPALRALRWLYDGALEWEDRLVVLARDGQEYVDKGFTPDRQLASFTSFSEQHGMPFLLEERPRMHATYPSCLAVVAARLRAPGTEERLLRRLRVVTMTSIAPLDDPATIARAAGEAGLDPDELAAWTQESEVQAALEEDVALARDPSPEALALRHKLAPTPGGGWRYTCPSLELTRLDDGRRLSVPGFQPQAAYEVAVANLAPEIDRREPPEDAGEVLRWAGEPLAAVEIAAVLGADRAQAEESLRTAEAEERAGWWSLAPAAVR